MLTDMANLRSKAEHKVSISSSSVSVRRKDHPSKVKKNIAVLKRAMSQRSTGWSSRDWTSRTKDRGQSSADEWKASHKEGKWRDVSANLDEVFKTAKEKTISWSKKLPRKPKKRIRDLQLDGKRCH